VMEILNEIGLDASLRDTVQLNWPLKWISYPLVFLNLSKRIKCSLAMVSSEIKEIKNFPITWATRSRVM
jgi:hypothetical protein